MDRTKLLSKVEALTFQELAQMSIMLVSFIAIIVLIWRRKVIHSKADNAMKRYMDKQMSMSSDQELLADQIDSLENCSTYYLPQAEMTNDLTKAPESHYLTEITIESDKPGTISHKCRQPVEEKDEEEERLTNAIQMKF